MQRFVLTGRKRATAAFAHNPGDNPGDDPGDLIRSELFSLERLEQHAETLAAAQPVTAHPERGHPLARRLRDNERVLLEAYRTIAAAIDEERTITPAAEWLVDNFHIAEEQIREVRDDLPRGFYRQLPKLADGPLQGCPRVFGIAWAFVAHSDSLFDPHTLSRFVGAYQRVQPLTIGELWAVAITLRIVLIENLRRAAERIVRRRGARQEADAIADRLLGVGGRLPESAESALHDFARRRLPTAFTVQLVQRLRDQDPLVTPVLRWLDERLALQGTTADEMVREEHQRQGAMNVTVRNVITSMRLMSAVDWAEFFEGVSLVDERLRAATNFAANDFATRDRYRHAIEELARGARITELAVTTCALRACHLAALPGAEQHAQRDPGFHLIGNGRRAFERQLQFRIPAREWIRRAYSRLGITGYLTAITTLSLLIVAALLVAMACLGVGSSALLGLALLTLVPAADTAIALINRHVTHRFGPSPLPALELRDGVPASLRTLIVVPTLLTSASAIEEQIERLEVHYLASPDDDFSFALLSDWTDSASEIAASDEPLLACANAGIASLNQQYGPAANGPRFLLLHRRRLWNAGEGQWMGWERKRGKLHELNRWLRGAVDTSFVAVAGILPSVPAAVRYVITLDADTRLPMGAARRLVGKMAHPLNQARFDPHTQSVVSGYGVLQPRVTPTLPIGRDGSLFQRVFSGPGGMDPYAFAVSDVYQDLFGQGSYTGKGIYDVDLFEAALAGRVPENTLLSHDLFEGIFARAGLASDIEVVEEFPARYDVDAARRHRWARGDWQLLPWLCGRGRRDPKQAPAARGALLMIGRWKMIDNLRRTLTAPFVVAALVTGWTLPLAAALAWTIGIVAMLALPALFPVFAGVVPRRVGISKRSHLLALAADVRLALAQILFMVTFLAHQAWLMSDAIGRTLFRLCISHRHMLEWLTAAQSKFSLPLNIRNFYRRMAGGILLTAVAIGVVVGCGHGGAIVAVPFCLLWLVSPVIAQWASRPPTLPASKLLSVVDSHTLRRVARSTWRYFETFVTAVDQMLPPDNFQEDPKPVIAHRTSPTNLGLYLLSIVSARDFGWLGVMATRDRLAATLATMDRLERYRGHFYNWYDTQDLRPLDPKYVSSVDSGNLAGHLLALGNSCREMIRQPILSTHWRAGIYDTLERLQTSLTEFAASKTAPLAINLDLGAAIEVVARLLGSPATSLRAAALELTELANQAEIIDTLAQPLAAGPDSSGNGAEVVAWAAALRVSISDHCRDRDELLPWASLLAEGPPGSGAPSLADTTPEEAVASLFASSPTLAELSERCEAALLVLADRRAARALSNGHDPTRTRSDALLRAFEGSARSARRLERQLTEIAERCTQLFQEMDFGFLFDPARQLLSIGYRVLDTTLDPSCYDLLASEARLASFIAIAKGDVPVKHWFRLGRALTPVDRGSALISWSGSMFEYLMPSLVMRAPAGSLLEQTSRFIVRRQMKYGSERGVPWGVSESAYNVRDLELTYQYSNFGVPGLGLKRGLSDDIVIAPYATALAAMVDAPGAVRNLATLTAAGGRGRYGFYEALDYTPARLPEGATVAVVHSYMAHHQGMTLVAIANALLEGSMRARFHAEPIIQATELLLQERTPRDVAVARPRAEEVQAAADGRNYIAPLQRRFRSPHDPTPRTHILSNGRYAVMLTAAGSGYSRCRDVALTRWREDVTCDGWGSYLYLRDVRSGDVWSAGYQPTAVEPESYEVAFAEDHAEIIRRDGAIVTTLEVTVSPEADAEVRRVSLSNLGNRTREIEITSYAEIVLAPEAADRAHPVFSNLFVQTEIVVECGALLATRRRRSPHEPEIWAAHIAVVEGESIGDLQYETDRAQFVGRGATLRSPLAVMDGRPLSNTVGAVLDPVFSLRRRLRITPGASVRVAFWTMTAPSRAEVLDMVDKHQDGNAFQRAATLAWTQAQVQLHHLGVSAEEAHLFQRLANHVLYSDPRLRPSSTVLQRSDRSQSALWAHGISGDTAIVLVRIDEPEDIEIVRQLLRAQEYWRLKPLAVDVVILNERPGSYAQDLNNAIEALVRTSKSHPLPEGASTNGSTFVLRADLLSLEVRSLLQSVARAVLLSRRGSLIEQLNRIEEAVPTAARGMFPILARRKLGARAAAVVPAAVPTPQAPLDYFNGVGGFSADGKEYVTILEDGATTPAPWINVIANPEFGFQVSAEGSGYTWAVNSREHQLTPWSNDPVVDPTGEAIYVRDEDSGVLWCPTATPIRQPQGRYVAHHGPGYSRFEHVANGIALDLMQFVSLDDPIKISRLQLHNQGLHTRRLSVTGYAEWVLGTSRGLSAPFLVSEIDDDSGAMLVTNRWSNEFGNRVAFADLRGRQKGWTADRSEFLGRHGSLAAPAALLGSSPLSNRVGAGFDPCSALQTTIELKAGARTEVVFLIGEGASTSAAQALLARYRKADLDEALAVVERHWESVLGTVQVQTPDPAMDRMLNRWLLYQTLACRVWARSAFYQASGAFGFRDQLQDVMALTLSQPQVERQQLLRAAARQFGEGDVQHWWLPHGGQGVRTRISDDLLWLPYVAAHYVEATGDSAVLDERIPFLDGPVLRADEHEAFFQPMIDDEHGSLFEHCARALDRSLAVGIHGLPLMGTGDWNDGMNRVGESGKGESVWLAWFLHATLTAFAPIAARRGEAQRAETWVQHASFLHESIERNAWDGDWYRRAYFDDGTPLGSATNAECRIDSIAQSWAVISQAGHPTRSRRAMESVDEHLVRRDEGGLVLLFAPPFDRTLLDPGYIKGYPPGIRENGGQYTHAAAWAVMAFAQLGDGDKAHDLFSLLNPIHHSDSAAAAQLYKVEPYVVAADVYSQPPHSGRGGWTWYTGSAAWLYRVGLESILGMTVHGTTLRLNPCIPRSWKGFTINYRYRSSRYEISIENPDGVNRGVKRSELDGVSNSTAADSVALVDDGATHHLRVRLG